jgi:hypothetical protein
MITLTACIKKVKNADNLEGSSSSKLSLKNIVVAKDFDFSPTRKVDIDILNSENVHIAVYEVLEDKSEKKLIGVFSLSKDITLSHQFLDTKSEILLVATFSDKVEYKKSYINSGNVKFDLR